MRRLKVRGRKSKGRGSKDIRKMSKENDVTIEGKKRETDS
jgi:hypothetical protein